MSPEDGVRVKVMFVELVVVGMLMEDELLLLLVLVPTRNALLVKVILFVMGVVRFPLVRTMYLFVKSMPR